MLTARQFFGRPASEISDDDEKAFFAGIRLRNRTFKTTARYRMPDFDSILTQHLTSEGINSVDTLDVAASSGVTTLDLHNALSERGIRHRIVATDLSVMARIVNAFSGADALVDAEGFLLQLSIGPLAIRPWASRRDWLNGRWVIALLARSLSKTLGLSGKQGVPVKLVSRRLDEVVDVNVVDDDLSRLNPEFLGRFQLVRAANILNHAYFSEAQLVAMIGNLLNYADSAGAVLAIVRTHADGSNHGTIFATGPGEIKVVTRVGQGSEVEAIVLSAHQARQTPV